MVSASDSAEVVRAMLEAEDIASRVGQRPGSVHLLLSFFTFPNRAQTLLAERGLDDDQILAQIRSIEPEPRGTLKRLQDHARQLAEGSGSGSVDSLHLLIAILRNRGCFAYRVLQRIGVPMTALRNLALSYVTGNMPKRYQHIPKPKLRPPVTRSFQPPTRAPLPPLQTKTRLEEAPIPEPKDLLDEDIDEEFDARPDVLPEDTQPSHGDGDDLQGVAPNLAKCGIDLCALARDGGLDRVIGRDLELERLIDTLGKRRSNNPILIGPPGVGKTALVEGLAVKIVREDPDVAPLHGKILVSLDTGSLIAGTSLRGAFAERLGEIKREVAAAGGQIIVFIDEIHTLVGAGASGDAALDAANELKAALARGEFPCIGATTIDEFKKYIEKDAALERRFDPIVVDEPALDDAVLMVEGAIQPYVEHHQIPYALDAVHAAVHLSHRFVPERRLPDKAFAALDLAGSRAKRRGAEGVVRMDVASVIHEWSGVPIERLLEDQKLRDAKAFIRQRFVGQEHAVDAITRNLKRGFAGFNGRRPMGSFLFAGPSGVGKTELVHILAEFLFGSRNAVVRLDMSEFAEKHSVARLIGAQRGYVGFEQGGDLTEALRRKPFQVVLFDEIEKGHPDVLNLLLQVLEEGILTDSHGRKVAFANTLVVLTTNLGAEDTLRPGVGFGQAEESGSRALDAAKSILPAALWSRLEEKLVFSPLSKAQLREVAALELQHASTLLFREREIRLDLADEILDFVLERAELAPQSGARPIRHAIQKHLEERIANAIVDGELLRGDRATVLVDPRDEALKILRAED